MANYDTSVKITDFNIDWMKIKSGCMTTISKDAGTKEPSQEWKENYYYVNIVQFVEEK